MIKHTRALYFPYVLKQLADKSWIILDRNYKPLGSGIMDFVTYEDHVKPQFRIKKITPAQAKKLSCSGDPHNEDSVYLYTDSCTPTTSKKYMDEYLKRLAVLMKIKLECEPTP